MIESTQFLSSYRKSIVSDEEALLILSHLHRSNSLTIEEIAELVGLLQHDLQRKTLELYRANLIKLDENRKVSLSSYGENILTELGITELAARSLVGAPGLTEWVVSFLELCLEARSKRNTRLAIQFLTSLKCLIEVEKQFEDDDEEAGFRKSLLRFVVIVGLDPDSHLFSAEEYFKRITSWHQQRKTDSWKQLAELVESSEGMLISFCKQAIDVTNISDTWFSVADTPRLTSDIDAIYLTTYTRLLSAAVCNLPDYKLEAVSWTHEDSLSKVLYKLAQWEPKLQTKTLNILSACNVNWATKHKSSQDLWRALGKKLNEVLLSDNRDTTLSETLNILHYAGHGSYSPPDDYFERTLAYIHFLRQQFSQGGYYENITPQQASRLYSELGDFRRELKTRIGFSPKPPIEEDNNQ